MGDMTVDELKNKKLWFLWLAKPGRNGKVTKVPFAANGGATGTDDAHISERLQPSFVLIRMDIKFLQRTVKIRRSL